MSRPKLYLYTLFAGIFLGFMTVFAKGVLVMLIVAAITGLFLWRFLPVPDRAFLIKIFIIGISLRIILLALFYTISVLQGGSGELTPDSRLYSLKALNIMRSWVTGTDIPLVYDERTSREGHLYLLALFYFFIGHNSPIQNPISIFSDKLINCLIGTITGIPFFYLCKNIFGKSAAKITCCLVVFFPSLILWSLTNIRESMNILLGCLVLFYLLKLQEKIKIRYLLAVLIYLFLLLTLRPYIFKGLLISIIISQLIITWLNLKRKILVLFIFILSITIFLNTTAPGEKIRNKVFDFKTNARNLYVTNQAIIAQGGSVYKIYDDDLSEKGNTGKLALIWILLKGWFYFMLVPLPWMVTLPFLVLVYPQIILWYFLLFFAIIGIFIGIRYNFKMSLILITYLIIITSGFALLEANVGSAFRHRDLVLPIYLIFSSAGIIHLFKRRSSFEKEK